MHDMRDLSVINDNGDFLGTISYKDIREHILKIYTDDRG
jgi:hypothetical protein